VKHFVHFFVRKKALPQKDRNWCDFFCTKNGFYLSPGKRILKDESTKTRKPLLSNSLQQQAQFKIGLLSYLYTARLSLQLCE